MRKGGDWLNECLTSLGPQQTSSHVLLLLDTLEGEWKEAGSGLFLWQNYYGHGPLNGLTKKERVLINLKEILAWNIWKPIQ